MDLKDTTEIVHKWLDLNSIMGRENNIQNFPDNPGPSTTKIQSEIYNNSFDNVSKSKTQNSSMEYASNEIINIPSDSDDDHDYNNSTSDLNDVSIIDTVKAVANGTASLDLPLYLTGDFSFDPLKDMSNIHPILASSSDGEAISVSNKNQDQVKIVGENNNNVSDMKKLSENPKPGCSKDSDDTSSKLKNSENYIEKNLIEDLLKDTRLIHALLPTYSMNLIFGALCNNKYARNRIELSLWDLLPMEKPLPQYPQKRKSMDDVCIVEYKRNLYLPPQKTYIGTETAMKKKEQCVTNTEKLEDKTSKSEIDGMKGNISEVTILNDTNNNIDQPSTTPMETKLDRTLDEPMYIEHDNDINMNVVQDFENSVSSKTDSKTKESIKNSKIKKKSKSLSDNKAKFPTTVTTVLQPAKLTFEPMRTSSQTFFKPPTPILSPPKFHFVKKGDVTVFHLQQMKQNGAIVPSVNLDLSANDSFAIPNTSANDKKASHIDASKFPNSKLTLLQNLSDFARDMDTEDTKSVNGSRILTKPLYFNHQSLYSQTLCSPKHNNRGHNISDHQGANSSKIYNFNTEILIRKGDMSTSQIPKKQNEEQVRTFSVYFA